MTTRIIKTLQEREAWALLGIGDVIKAVREEIARILPRDPAPIHRANGKPTVILIVGVNGTGKTTSTAKLAHYLQDSRDSSKPASDDWGQSPLARASVMLAAADTFRAAAIEQLDIWAKRLGTEMIRGQAGRRSSGTLLRGVSGGGETRSLIFCFATQPAGNTRKRISCPSCTR